MKGIVKKIVSVILTAALIVTAVNYVPGPETVKAEATSTTTNNAKVTMEMNNKTAFDSKDGDLYNYVKYGVTAEADGAHQDRDTSKAVDGSVSEPNDRWSNDENNKGHWIQVDLKQSYSVSKIGISWEVASSLDYKIEVSNDGREYQEVTHVTIKDYTTASNRIDQITLANSVKARYIKITDVGAVYIPNDNNSERRYGMSIWEIGIFGDGQIFGGTCDKGTVECRGLGSNSTGETFSNTVDTVNILNNYVRFSGVSQLTNTGTNPSDAIDNNKETRWVANSKENVEYIVDLKNSYPVSKIFVCWETASASKYHIAVSNDGATYKTIATLDSMPWAGGNANDDVKRARTDKLTLNTEVYARYVKICVDTLTKYGTADYNPSIWEIGIYGISNEAVGYGQVGNNKSEAYSNNDTHGSDGIDSGQPGWITNFGPIDEDDDSLHNYLSYTNYRTPTAIDSTNNNSGDYVPSKAIDGNKTTRWGIDNSLCNDDIEGEYITIDLAAEYNIRKICISWDAAKPSIYNIETSNDGVNYDTAATVKWPDDQLFTDNHRVDKVTLMKPVKAQYVRIHTYNRVKGEWGVSIWEVGIYGPDSNAEHYFETKAFDAWSSTGDSTTGNIIEGESCDSDISQLSANGLISYEGSSYNGGKYLGHTVASYAGYKVHFDRKTSKVKVHYSGNKDNGKGTIKMYVDNMSGDPVVTIQTKATVSGWHNEYLDATADVEISAGDHKIFMVFTPDKGMTYVCNLDYFQFEYAPEPAAGVHEAEKAHGYIIGAAGGAHNITDYAPSFSGGHAVGDMNVTSDNAANPAYMTTYVQASEYNAYQMKIIYAAEKNTKIQYRVDNGSWKSMEVPYKGGDWATVNTLVATSYMELCEGIHKIDITGAITTGENEYVNLDCFELESLTYYAFNDRDTSLVGNKIEAEAYNQSCQMADKPLSQDKNGSLSGGGNLGGTRNGNYARYNVYFDRRTSKVKFLYSANNEATGNIEIYVDGITENNLVGKILTHSTSTDDQWTNYQELSGELDKQIEQGEHAIYLKFVPDVGKTYVANIDYFQFEYTPQKINNKNKHINNEAEDAHTYIQGSSAGSYAIEKHINYSGGKAVKDMKTMTDAERSYFTTYVNAKTAGDYILTIAYGTKSKSAHLDYSVNGNGDGSDNEQWTSLETPTTGAYDTVKKVTAKVTLKKGINIIDISGAISDSGDDYLNIDYFRLDKVTEDVNLALGKPVQSCTYQVNDTEGSFIPGNAVDGDDSTQWAANKAGDNWLAIDLEEAYEIEEVKILFGTAYASDFEIQISNDDRVWDAPDNSDAWITARTVTNYLEGNALSDGTTSTQWTSAGVGEFGYLCLGKARYIRIKVNNVGGGHENASIFEFKVYGKRITDDNLALNKSVTASSSTGDKAENAVDGDNSTRWGSSKGATQWYQVDLGKESILNSVDIKFERDYPINFTISILNENGTWEEVYRAEGWSEPGEQKNITDETKKLGYSIHLDGVKARYIKIEGTELNQKGWSGMSIWEFEVWGQEVDKEYYWEEQAQKTYGIYPISESDYNKNAIESQVDKDGYPVLDPTLVQGAVLGTGDTYEVLYEADKKIYFYVNPYNIYLYDNKNDEVNVTHGTVAWSGETAVSGADYNPSVATLIKNKFNDDYKAASVCYQLPDKDTFNTLLEEQNRADYITTEIKCQVTGVDKDKNSKSAEITFRLKIIKSSLSIKDTIMTDGCIHVDTVLSYGINNDSADGVTYEWQRSDEGITWESVSEKRYDLSIISNNGQDVNVANDIGGGKYYRVRAVKGTDFGEWSHPYHIPYYNEVQNGGFEEPEMYSTDDPNRKFPFNSNLHGGLQQYPNGYKGLFWKTTGPGCWNKRNGMQIGHDIEIVNARHLLVDETDQVNRFSVTKGEMYTDDNGTLKTHDHNSTGEILDHGNQFAELNAENTGALYQDILTTPSSTCVWALDHAGRWEENTMLVVAMSTKVATENPSQTEPDSIITAVKSYETAHGVLPTEGDKDAYNKGTTISANGIEFTVWRVTSQDKGKWSCHTGTYKVSESKDNYLTRFFFVSEKGYQDDKTVGNLLDNVSFETVKPYTIEYWVKGESDTDYQQVAIINKTALPYDRVNIPLTISEIQNSGGTINDGYNNLNLYSYTLTRAVMNENLYDIQYDQDGKSQMTVAAYHDHLILYYDYAAIAVTKKIEGLKQNDIPGGYTIEFTIKYMDSSENLIGEDGYTLSVANLEWVYAEGDSAEGYLANMKFKIPSDVIEKAGGRGIKYEVVETLKQVPKLEGTNYYLQQVKAGNRETNIPTDDYFNENTKSSSYTSGEVTYEAGQSNSVRFLNVYDSIRKVTVTKNVDCKFLEEYPFKDDRAFEFTLNVTKDNNPISAAKYGDGIVADETKGSYQFTLKHGESVDLYVLAGCDVTVQEADYSQAGYEAIAWNAEGATASTDVVDANDKIGRKVILSEISAETLLTCKNIKVYYGDVEVQGFQMNTDTSKGGVSEYSPSFRVVSRACKRLIGSDGKLHNVKAYGTIYSLDSNVNGNYNEKMRLDNAANSDQIYGTDEFSSAIYYFESKVGTYIDWTTGQPEDPYYNYFALTFVRKSYSYPWLNTDMAFRAYARLDNGEIVYGTKVYTVNIYKIADNLYQNTKMGTKKAHEFLYTNVLNLVTMEQNRVDICFSMLNALKVPNAQDPQYTTINTINKDIVDYVYCQKDYTYQGREEFSPKSLSGVEISALLSALNGVKDPATTYNTLFDWIYNETENYKSYKGFYKKVPYDWDNSIYMKSKTQ